MTTKLAAVCGRRSAVTALVALVAGAVALTAAVPARADAATTHTPLLAQGAGMGAKPSPAVRSVQRVLRSAGYSLGRPGVDGRFGPLTAAAVRRLQANYGLTVDGIVGPRTRKLVRLIERRPQRSSATRKARPNRQPVRRPAPTTTKPAGSASSSSGSPSAGWLVGVALVSALAAFFAALAVMRRHRPLADAPLPAGIAPIVRELYVAGRSRDERVADFRGQALAAAVTIDPGVEPTQDRTWYLVDDARKRTPVWVRGEDVQRSPSRLDAGEPVIGYVTVAADSSRQQIDSTVREIEAACERADWELAEVVTDRETGRMLERPGLAYALEQIALGKARGLVVHELRRLSRSVDELGVLLRWFRDAQAGLVALDLGIDTSTPTGHEVAATLITLGDWEHERIAKRTRGALAEVRSGGRRTGRPAVRDRPELVERINVMRSANMTLQAIADQLNAEGVPTLRGGAMWRPSNVQAALGYRRPGTRSPRDQLPTLEDGG